MKTDKIKHLIAGFLITFVSTIFINSFFINLILVTLVACLKELYDYYKQVKYKSNDYEVSVWDALATIGGGGIGFLLINFIKNI